MGFRNRWSRVKLSAVTSIIAAFLLPSLCLGEAADANASVPIDSGPRLNFGKPSVHINGVADEASTSTTVVENTISVLFDTASLNLQKSNGPLVGSWKSSLRFPVKTLRNKAEAFQAQLRIGVTKTAHTNAMVKLRIGGQTFTRQFRSDRNGRDVNMQVVGNTRIKDPLFVSISVEASRRSKTEAVLVQVDSLDVHFGKPIK